ncbi:Zinc finger CCCH domain-containing protein 27 [Porphyridium purpureum]|uniref:Zinc finger CCCH domain-containing protein 27 n=1 Tax=Porphyridium purpureum TaxID=35688 RepID=A0A5J4Z6H7_PORPP|nr:Zinc finger CCCH domain-containing protein 27 [Porphyridium purpureum]|eukprot:POR4487..scf295_1
MEDSGLNDGMVQWMETELARIAFDGERDTLAKYAVALLEVQAETLEVPVLTYQKAVENDDVKDALVGDLSDFLAEKAAPFAHAVIEKLKDLPIQRVAAEEEEEQTLVASDGAAMPQPTQENSSLPAATSPQETDLQDGVCGRAVDFGSKQSLDHSEPVSKGSFDLREKLPTRESEPRCPAPEHTSKDKKDLRGRIGAHAAVADDGGRDLRKKIGKTGQVQSSGNAGVRRGQPQERSRAGERSRTGRGGRADAITVPQPVSTPAAGLGMPVLPGGVLPPKEVLDWMAAQQAAAMKSGGAPAFPFPVAFPGGVSGSAPAFPSPPFTSTHTGMDQGGARGHGRGRGRGRGGIISGTPREDVRSAAAPPSFNDRTLVVKNVPREMLTIFAVGDWFKKFGTITNIQLSPPEAPEVAYVEFVSQQEAQAAHDSIEAIMDNRHVKLFWAQRDAQRGAKRGADDAFGVRGAAEQRGLNRGRGRGGAVPSRGMAIHAEASAVPGTLDEAPNLIGETAEQVNERKRQEILKQREDQKRRKLEEANALKQKIEEQKALMHELETNPHMDDDSKLRISERLRELAGGSLIPEEPQQQADAAGMNPESDGWNAGYQAASYPRGGLGYVPRGRGALIRGFGGYPRTRGGRGRGGFGVGGQNALDLRSTTVLMMSKPGTSLPDFFTPELIQAKFRDVQEIRAVGASPADGLVVEFGSRRNAEFAVERAPIMLGISAILDTSFVENPNPVASDSVQAITNGDAGSASRNEPLGAQDSSSAMMDSPQPPAHLSLDL